jgi:hypothetical protein
MSHTGRDHRQINEREPDLVLNSASPGQLLSLRASHSCLTFLVFVKLMQSESRSTDKRSGAQRKEAGTAALHNTPLWTYTASELQFSCAPFLICKSTAFLAVMHCSPLDVESRCPHLQDLKPVYANVLFTCYSSFEMFEPLPDLSRHSWTSPLTVSNARHILVDVCEE